MSAILYVAEIGSNHEGNPALACEMIRQFANAGASIIKFQFGWTQEAQARQGKAYLPIRYISREFAFTISDYCSHIGIELMASIWSADGLETAKAIGMRRYKMAYAMRNDPLLIKVLEQHRQVFVSGGVWGEFTVPIFCISKYPTYPEDLAMPEKFGGEWYGYSDHHHGIGACLLAVARGAMYIEKHATLNKASQTIRDNAFSATPDEFSELVRLGTEIERVRHAPPG